jgi:hypothetical protein
MTDRIDITDNMRTMQELWPGAKITEPEMAEFRSQLAPLKQDVLDQAIRLVYGSSDKRRPVLSAIKAQYSRLMDERTYTPEPRYTGTMTWHVAWQRTSKHGVPGAWYGCRCQSRHEAEQIAKANGGRVTCMSKADDGEDYSDEALRADEIRARETLAGLSRNKIAAMVDRLRSIGFVTEKLPARLSDWPRMAALTVYAEYRNQQERRK